MHNLKIITSTTREQRKGPVITNWIAETAKQYSQFDVEVLDLAEINLPLMDEPFHPRLQKYQNEHTKQWSAEIDEADAFIFVLAEYNHSFPAPIKNALDYLSQEWNYKPLGFVSYGGMAGGARSVNSLLEVVTTLKMMPLPESVSIPFFTQFINDQNIFVPNDIITKAADTMLKELARWANALESLRVQEAV